MDHHNRKRQTLVCLLVVVIGLDSLILYVTEFSNWKYDNVIRQNAITFVGSTEYTVKAQTFHLSEKQALDAACNFDRASGHENNGWAGNHYMIVGNCYVFSSPDKRGICLCGFYVNGIDGTVEWRGRVDSDPDAIPFAVAREHGYRD